MFKPKTKKPEVKEEVIETVDAPEEEIEDEEVPSESEEKTKENTDEKPTEEQKINLTSGEVISIIEFNLQRAIQSLQLLK